jgi:putative transposase
LSKEERKQYSAEEKIRSMLDGLRGEHSIAELCRRGLVEGVLGGRQMAPCGRYLELRLLKKKHYRGRGKRRMKYSASEKLEIIRLVEQSHLPVHRTLEKLGASRATFYRWYELCQTGGL